MADNSRFPDSIQKPTFPQFTNLALNEGLVDQLMATVNHHLEKQYAKGRLAGSDFAQVYVGSIASVMQFSTQYLLGIMLIDEQKAKADAETSLLYKQQEQIDHELILLDLKEAELRYRVEQLLPLEKQKLELEVIKVQQEGLLIEAQIRKIDADILFLDAQTTMMEKQADKIDKEIEFLTAKIRTEQANTIAGIADGNSLIGRQMSLLAAQKLGFAGDIHVKVAKVYADYDAVFQSVQEVPEDATLKGGATGALSSATSIGGSIAGV
jgi:hypothetical protein